MCKWGMKIQRSAKHLLHNQNENTNTISGPSPHVDRRAQVPAIHAGADDFAEKVAEVRAASLKFMLT